MALTDIITLGATSHSYSGGGTGANSIDGNYSTAQSATNSGDYNSTTNIVSQHTFSTTYTITRLDYRFTANVGVYGDSDQTSSMHWKIEYLVGTTWTTVTGLFYDNSAGGNSVRSYDSGNLSSNVSVACIGIRANVWSSTGSQGDSRTNNCDSNIYEIQAYSQVYTGVGIKYYDGANVVELGGDTPATAAHKFRCYKGSTVYGLPHLATSDTNASKIRVYVDGVYALPKAT